MIHLILTLTSGVVSCGPRYRTAHLILTLTSGVVSCGPRYRTATSSYKYLQSPGYNSALGYPTTAECSWRIRASIRSMLP